MSLDFRGNHFNREFDALWRYALPVSGRLWKAPINSPEKNTILYAVVQVQVPTFTTSPDLRKGLPMGISDSSSMVISIGLLQRPGRNYRLVVLLL